MNICKNCGVELENDMQTCPLCGQPVNTDKAVEPVLQQQLSYNKMTAPQKKFTWEIVSLILLSAVIATLVINFIIDKHITWSQYPVAFSLVIFSYVSLFAFWRQRTILQITVGFALSSACLLAIHALTGSIDWTFTLGIPLLFAANIMVILLIAIIDASRHKGINLLAWTFLAAGLLCICIDGVLSYYKLQRIHLTWSIIAGLCTIPVILVLFFVHSRLKKGRNLKRTFHV